MRPEPEDKQMKTLAAFAMASLMAMPAFAGSLDPAIVEPPITTPPVVVVAPTGGEWTGFYAGGQLGYGDVVSTGKALEGNGAIGGVHAGYNRDFGKLVLGGELDYDLGNVDLSNGAGTLDSVARLKLRAGADLGRVLVYGTAGLAMANATVGKTSRSGDGYFGGLGADYALSDKWSVGGEVLLHRFDNFDGTGVNLNATTATARASFRF